VFVVKSGGVKSCRRLGKAFGCIVKGEKGRGFMGIVSGSVDA
jgi:hypothetical protein